MNRFGAVLICVALGIPTLVAQTGVAVPELAALDRDIPAIMASAHVPGGAVAIVKDGRLVLARGYGKADVSSGEAFQPDSLCRIGSVSKTVTAVTIVKLVEAGRLGVDEKAFAGILTQLQPPPRATVDPRLKDISVRHLLHHTGGHGRDTGVDPLNIRNVAAAAATFHKPIPPGYDTVVRYAMGLPLDFDPGTKYSYSNYGFAVLGRVIERVTGQPYEEAVRQQVLAPLGLRRMAVGHTLPEDRLPGEVHYYDTQRAPLVLSLLANVRRLVPMPYANFELDAADSCGRWIASAVDLARFVARVEGTRAPAFFAPDSLQLLFERPEPFVSTDPSGNSWYALGTGAFRNGAAMGWSHTGFYAGAYGGYLSFGDGYLFAFVFNGSPDNSTFIDDVYNVLITTGLNQKTWPSHDLFPTYYPED